MRRRGLGLYRILPLARPLLVLLGHGRLLIGRARRHLFLGRLLGLVLFRVRPLDLLRKVDAHERHPLVETLVEVVKVAVKLLAALGLLDAQNLGAARLPVFVHPGDAARRERVGCRKRFEARHVGADGRLAVGGARSHDESWRRGVTS